MSPSKSRLCGTLFVYDLKIVSVYKTLPSPSLWEGFRMGPKKQPAFLEAGCCIISFLIYYHAPPPVEVIIMTTTIIIAATLFMTLFIIFLNMRMYVL
jgi:hypothetical protein